MKKLYIFLVMSIIVLQLHAQNWTNVSVGFGITNVASVIDFPGQGILVATRTGIYKYSNNVFFNFPVSNATEINKMQEFGGKLYVSTDNGLYIWTPGVGTEILTTASGLMSNFVHDVAVSGNSMWIFQKQYLTLFDGNSFVHFDFFDMWSHPNNSLWETSAIVDLYGNVFFSFKQNILQYNGTSFDTIKTFSENVTDIELNPATNQMFVATNDDVYLRNINQYVNLFSKLDPNSSIEHIEYIPSLNKIVIVIYHPTYMHAMYLYDIGSNTFQYGGYIDSYVNDICVINSKIYVSTELGLFANEMWIFESTFEDVIEHGNFKASFTAKGNLFWNGMTHTINGQEVHLNFPGDENKITVFASSMWIGGINQNNQLCLAAERFLQVGTDYDAGPVSDVYDSNYDERFSNLWKLSKDEIIYHSLHYNSQGYQMVRNIEKWPAHGDVQYGEAPFLAPFYDANQNGIYDPQNGDYPIIQGEQAIYMIFSDDRNPNSESGSQQIGIEIHAMAYVIEVHQDSVFNDVLFLKYNVFNRRNNDYTQLYIGHWSDIDIGHPYDDYIGCDTILNCFYGYNGDLIDGYPNSTTNLDFYLNAPPAQSIVFLNNNMNAFVFHNNFGFDTLNADPHFSEQYYNLLKGYKSDGTSWINPITNQPSHYIFPGNPFDTNQWSEITSGNIPFDRRGLGSIGPFDFASGESFCFDIAYVYNRDCTDTVLCDNLSNIPGLLLKTAHVRDVFQQYGNICPMQNTTLQINPIQPGIDYQTASVFIYCDQINYSLPVDQVILISAKDFIGMKTLTDWEIHQGTNVIELKNVLFDVPGNSRALLLLNLNNNPSVDRMESFTFKYFTYGLTGVDELAPQLFSIAPNPSNDEMKVMLNSDFHFPVIVTIIDQNGKEIYECFQFSQSQIIDVSSLTSGQYFISCSDTQGNSQTLKFVKK